MRCLQALPHPSNNAGPCYTVFTGILSGGDAAGNLAALQCDPESRRVASLAECHVGERAISAVAIASSGGVLVAGAGGYTQLRDLNREGMEVVHSWRLPSRCGINALACQGLTVLAGSSDPAAQVRDCRQPPSLARARCDPALRRRGSRQRMSPCTGYNA